MKKDMLVRILTSFIILAIFLILFIASFYPILFELTVACLIVLCIYEGINATGNAEKLQFILPSMVYGLLIPLTFSIKQILFPFKSAYYGIIILSFIYLLIEFVISMTNFESVKFTDTTTVMFITMVISCFLTNIIFIRKINENGFFYMILAIVCFAWVTDIFAYFVGMLFGKHKLSPHISPKKTIEGAIGGTVFSVLFTIIFCLVYSQITDVQFNWLAVVVYSLLCTIIGQIGDLSFSYIKRTYGIKDFGKILPGHGGFLDRLDSLIFIAPLFYMLISFKDIII
jgi:cytidylyltransferase family